MPAPFLAMEWASERLQRLRRSSLFAEAQAAALGIDALMRVKIYLALGLRPAPTSHEAMRYLNQSPFITDARCLHDVSRSITASLGNAEERAAVKVNIVNAQMAEINAARRWARAQPQLADGLAEVSSRQTMADVLRRGVRALLCDPDIAAGKRLSKRAVEQREEELGQASDDLAAEFEAVPEPTRRARQ